MAENGTGLAVMPIAAGLPGSGGGVFEILEAIWRRRLTLVLVTAVALALGTLAVLAFPQRYRAVTQITIDPRGVQVLDKELTPRSSSAEAQASLVDTEMRVLVSDLVLGAVVAANGLNEDPEFLGQTGLVSRLRAALLGPRARTPEERSAIALEGLRARVRTLRLPGTYAIQLSTDSLQAEKSARLARSIVASYMDVKSNQRREASRRASEALDARLGDLRERVAQAEGAVEAYKRENLVMGADGRLNNEQQLQEVTSQLVAARNAVSERQSRATQIEGLLRSGGVGEDLPEALQSGAPPEGPRRPRRSAAAPQSASRGSGAR